MKYDTATSILITNFDGTMTERDFYELAAGEFLRHDTHDYWTFYNLGTISHYEAMARIYGELRCREEELVALLPRMEPDPRIPAAISGLREAGWDVVVVSNGSHWYVDRILAAMGVSLRVHSNPGEFLPGKGLVLERPVDSEYYSVEYGIDKRKVVQQALGQYGRVAFAGNGPPDLTAALEAPAELRFARGWLAETLASRGDKFHTYRRWSEIAEFLCSD